MKLSSPGLSFPEKLVINIFEDETNDSLENIALTLTIFAQRKNNYHLGPPLSNADGKIVIHRDWVREAIRYLMNLYIMDYATPMEQCMPSVGIKVMSKDEIPNAISAMKLYRMDEGGPTAARTARELLAAMNEHYEPREIYFDLNMPNEVSREIALRLHKSRL